MANDRPNDRRTALIHPNVHVPGGFRSPASPTFRGSTTFFSTCADIPGEWCHCTAPYSYGLFGTPTTLELAHRISELDGGTRTFITPGGQAAIAVIYMAFTTSGSHVLAPRSAYGDNRGLADTLLKRYGVEVEYYEPLIGGHVERLFRPNTRLLWCESPGWVSMEVQDVPALAAAAHKYGITVALDNTYATGYYFDAFRHGVDVTMQALTKYVGGHSDILLGSVTVRDESLGRAVGTAHQFLGCNASPDDCSLALRGLQTLAVRLDFIESSAVEVATWLAARPEVETVLHPALPSCPGHEFWRRDFTGSSGIFSVVLRNSYERENIMTFVDALRVFKIGYGWGGVTSLAMPFLPKPGYGDPRNIVRFSIGLECTDDLVRDVALGLKTLAPCLSDCDA